jgi:hypothetical protein
MMVLTGRSSRLCFRTWMDSAMLNQMDCQTAMCVEHLESAVLALTCAVLVPRFVLRTEETEHQTPKKSYISDRNKYYSILCKQLGLETRIMLHHSKKTRNAGNRQCPTHEQ